MKKKDESEMDNGAPVVRVTRATPVLPPGVTDDTPDFNREMVMLDIPDELFGNSFTMVTNISKIIGDLMMVGIVCLKFYRDLNKAHTINKISFLKNYRIRHVVMQILCNISSHCWAKRSQ